MDPMDTSTVIVSRRNVAPTLDEDPDCTVVWLGGEHDICTAGDVAAALRTAEGLDGADIVIDLRAVQFMGSAIITVFLEAESRLRGESRRLMLRRPSRSAQRVVELCGLQALFERGAKLERSTVPNGALATWVSVPVAVLVKHPETTPSDTIAVPGNTSSLDQTFHVTRSARLAW